MLLSMISILLFIFSIAWLIFALITKKGVRNPVIGILSSIVLLVIGLVINTDKIKETDKNNETEETIQAEEEAKEGDEAKAKKEEKNVYDNQSEETKSIEKKKDLSKEEINNLDQMEEDSEKKFNQLEIVISNDLIGMTLEEATEKLKEQMLEIGDVIEQSNDKVDEGLVFQMNPKAGSTVLEDSEIDLYVSLGEEPFELSDYIGKDYEEVRAKLTELGFEVNNEEQTSEEMENGKILDQDLVAGKEVLISESTVTFIVSTGKPVIYLRDLSGYSQTSVDDYVKSQELNLTVEEKSSEEVALGLVISQKPEAGTSLNAGDRITVVYSTGPK